VRDNPFVVPLHRHRDAANKRRSAQVKAPARTGGLLERSGRPSAKGIPCMTFPCILLPQERPLTAEPGGPGQLTVSVRHAPKRRVWLRQTSHDSDRTASMEVSSPGRALFCLYPRSGRKLAARADPRFASPRPCPRVARLSAAQVMSCSLDSGGGLWYMKWRDIPGRAGWRAAWWRGKATPLPRLGGLEQRDGRFWRVGSASVPGTGG
jgi:hypothetical protein